MCGPAGSGKSTLARRFELGGYVRLSFDEAAWQRGHRAHPVPDSVAVEIHANLRDRLVALIGQGHDVVVDASFWSRAARQSYRCLVAPLGAVAVTYYVAVTREQVLSRLGARRGTGPHDVIVSDDLARKYFDGFQIPPDGEGPLVIVEAAD